MLPGRGKLCFILEVAADMRPRVSDPIPLERIISGIEEFDEELAVYAPAGSPVSPETPVYLVDEELVAPPEGTEYVLEVSLMRNVIKVWSAWRNGAVPSIPQACEAVLHYAERDAYLPVSGPRDTAKS
jgi:hypothetical protein